MSFPGEVNSQQDVVAEESSAPQPETTQSESQSASPAPSEQPQENLDRQVPFHEHPRFKELIEERRSYATQLEQMKAQMENMQRSQQESARAAQPKPVNTFVEKLREIDPSYAQYIESLEARASKTETIEQRLDAYERARIVNEYESTVTKLHTDNKIPAELQPLVRQQLDAMARSGELRDIKDVPNAYKKVAEVFSKFTEGLKRSTTASYVQDKSKDASTPSSQPKGKTAPRNQKGQFTGDRESDMQIIAQRALKQMRGEGEI